MKSYEVGTTATCPHCGVDVQFVAAEATEIHRSSEQQVDYLHYKVERDSKEKMNNIQSRVVPADKIRIMACRCPRWDCNRLIVSAKIRHWDRDRQTWKDEGSFLVYPHTSNRKPVPPQVPDHIREDYEEACLVLSASTKASAALSRRCLQSLLRAQGYQQHDLSDQIDAVLPTLPKDVADTVDAIRNIGNFAAHTIKSKSTGEILPVEPGEAEWSLEVLEALFEHYYERPTRLAERRKALNEKLSDAGKPPAKGSTP